jgi:hypothetical protein
VRLFEAFVSYKQAKSDLGPPQAAFAESLCIAPRFG